MKKITYLIWGLFISCSLNAQNSANQAKEKYELAQNSQDLKLRLYYAKQAVEQPDPSFITDHHFLLARTAVELAFWEEAYKFYKYMFSKDPTNEDVNHELGLVCLQLEKREESYDYLRRAVELGQPLFKGKPKTPYWVSYGEVQLAWGEYQKAIYSFSEAIKDKSEPKYLFKAYQGRGRAWSELKQPDKALSDFETANQYVGASSAAEQAKHQLHLGELSFQSQDYTAAAKYYKRATELEDNNHLAFARWGICLLEQGKVEESIAQLSKAIELRPSHDYQYHRSRVYVLKQQVTYYEKALQDIQSAITQENTTPIYYFQRGYIQYLLKSYPAAVESQTEALRQAKTLSDAMAQDPNLPIASKTKSLNTQQWARADAYLGWSKFQNGRILKDVSQVISSRTDFDAALRRNPKDYWAESGSVLAKIYTQKDSLNAISMLDKAILQSPLMVVLFLERGKLWLQKGDLTSAIRDFTEAIRLIINKLDENASEEDLKIAYQNRVQARLQAQNWSEVSADLDFLMRQSDSLNYVGQRAIVRFQTKQFEAALKDLNVYLDKNPTHAMSWLYKSQCFEALGDGENCKAALEKARNLDPKQPEIVAYCQKLLKKRMKLEKPNIIWHALAQLNHPPDYQIWYYKGASEYLNLHGEIVSLTKLKKYNIAISGKRQNVNLYAVNDTLYKFDLRFRLEATEFLRLEVKLENEVGETALSRDIFVKTTSSCTKLKRGLALVIGNEKYSALDRLRNPIRDARAIGDSLKKLGFDVITLWDATLEEMQNALTRFVEKLAEYETGFLYYSGHGVQSEGSSYLIPVDYKLKEKIIYGGYGLQKILNLLNNLSDEQRPCNMVILLDACRTAGSNGFRLTEPLPKQTLIGFSADDGQEASDASATDDKQGLYAYYLLQHLLKAEPFEDILKRVRRDVAAESRQKERSQDPVYSSSLEQVLQLRQ